jgi:hypothetical protein
MGLGGPIVIRGEDEAKEHGAGYGRRTFRHTKSTGPIDRKECASCTLLLLAIPIVVRGACDLPSTLKPICPWVAGPVTTNSSYGNLPGGRTVSRSRRRGRDLLSQAQGCDLLVWMAHDGVALGLTCLLRGHTHGECLHDVAYDESCMQQRKRPGRWLGNRPGRSRNRL